MKVTTRAMAGVMALSTLAVASQAQAEEPYTTVEGWAIYGETDKLGCIMERVVESGLLVRMGKIKETNKFGYLAVYTQDESVEVYGNVVSNEEAVLDLDGKRFTGTVVGRIRDGGWRGGSVKANNPDFGTALAKSYVLTLNPEGENPIEISLDGTFNAMAETQTCNQ